jgi:RNA polymerase primary sigma factor
MSSRPPRQHNTLETLLEKAGAQGYLSMDDIFESFPEAARDTDRLNAILASLKRRGVEALDPDDDDDDASRDPAADSASEQPRPAEETFASDDPISIYLKEMSRVPLLSVEEEFALAVRIEEGRAARTRLERRGPREVRNRRALEALVADGQDARDRLIKANTRLVVSIAKRYMNNGFAFLDLIQEGNLGLMKAVEKYDYHRGFRFSTYATWWIRQSITRAIADHGRTIRLPVHMADRLRLIFKTQRELEQKLGRQPTIEELAAALDLPVRKVQWTLKVSWQPLSLESPVNDDEEAELGQFIEDDNTATPMQSAYQSMLRSKLSELLDELPLREAQVLRLRFGLNDGNEYTLEEVGQKFGLTRERIRQIENNALRHLRHPRKTLELKEYL